MSKETKFKFIIQLNNQNIELTIEEAEKLYTELEKIFDRERSDYKNSYPKPMYISPSTQIPPLSPSVPQIPWIEPKIPNSPNIIYCNLDNPSTSL